MAFIKVRFLICTRRFWKWHFAIVVSFVILLNKEALNWDICVVWRQSNKKWLINSQNFKKWREIFQKKSCECHKQTSIDIKSLFFIQELKFSMWKFYFKLVTTLLYIIFHNTPTQITMNPSPWPGQHSDRPTYSPNPFKTSPIS